MAAFDDERAAMEDIANSPEVSVGEAALAGKKPLNVKMAGPSEAPEVNPDADAKIARVFSVSFKKAMKHLTGAEMDKTTADDVSEVAALGVEVLRGLPRSLFIGAVVAAFLAPWGPVVYRLLLAKPEKTNE